MGQSLSSVFDDTVFSNFAVASQDMASREDYRQNLRKCTVMCKYYASTCFPYWDADARKVFVRPPNPFNLVNQSAEGAGVHWGTLFFVMALSREVNYNLSFQLVVDANVDVMLRHLCREIVESERTAKDEGDALSHAKRLKSMTLDTAARIVATAVFKSFVRYSTLMAHHFPSADKIHPDSPAERDVTERRIRNVADILRYARSKKDVTRFERTFRAALDAYVKEIP